MMLLEVGWSRRLAPVLFPVRSRVPQPVPSVLCERCVCSAGMSSPAAGRQIFTCSADTRPGRLREKGPPTLAAARMLSNPKSLLSFSFLKS